MATAPVAAAPVRAEYRGVIEFTEKMLVSRPQGGVPVTGKLVKTENPEDPVLAGYKPTLPVYILVYEIATGAQVMGWHDKLDKAQNALRSMKAGTWVRYPKVSRKSAADGRSVSDKPKDS